MKKMLRIAAVGALSLGLLAGCGTGSQTTWAGDKDKIYIGGDLELTGKVATYGVSTNEAVKLAFKEQNAAGGILGKEIVWEVLDNKSDASESTAAATKLTSDYSNKLTAIIGAVASTNTLAVVQVATDNKIPLITPASTSTDVTVKENQLRDYIFRACFIDPFQGQVAANFASKELKKTTAAMLVAQSSDYSKGLAEQFQKQFDANGGKIVEVANYMEGDKDFKAVLTRIQGKNPDVIFVPGYYGEVGIIAKQARDAGITASLLGGDGWDSPVLAEIAGTKNLNNAYFVNHVSADDPAVQEFVAKYEKEYGKKPDALAFLGYDAARMLIQAIGDAGSADPENVRKALETIKNFEGVTGKISIDPATHNPVKSAVVIELKDGVQKFAARVSP